MIDKFLKAKHWQIFLLTLGLQFILQINFIPIILKSNELMFAIIMIPLIMFISFSGFLYYFWSLGIGLQSFIAENIKLKILWFKILFVYLTIYICGFSSLILILGFMNFDFSQGGILFGPACCYFPFPVFLPFNLVAVFSFFWILIFISKSIIALKDNKKAPFFKYFGVFILFCLYPIGIWIVQPMINKLTDKKSR